MKGFGIEIKNNLLEKKHIETMGVSVWLYMWFIDKMTSVNEVGVGKILGGKPIKSQDVCEELGVSERTYHRWVVLLRNGGYINTLQTPYGLVVTVNKAYKRFGNRVAKSGRSQEERELPKVATRKTKVATLSDKSGNSNKTVTVDNTIRQDNTGLRPEDDIAFVIKLFEPLNPSVAKLYGNTTQRKAVVRLIEKHGTPKLMQVVSFIEKFRGDRFCPTITTPVQLEDKWGALESFALKLKTSKPQIVSV